jgi:type 1 glutamine amidotransferase
MKALIVYGGFQPHEPGPTAEIIDAALRAKGAETTLSQTLDSFGDAALVKAQDVVIPIWTMGNITGEQWKTLDQAVRGGVGVAGFHGGLGDSMRGCLGFQWMVGGQFVGHPTVGEYEVCLTDTTHPIMAGMPAFFTYKSEQYYQIVDPGIHALAKTVYHYDGHKIIMPCIWTKTWGKGRVFYSALGHKAQEFRDYPHVLEMTVRGILWAGKQKLD